MTNKHHDIIAGALLGLTATPLLAFLLGLTAIGCTGCGQQQKWVRVGNDQWAPIDERTGQIWEPTPVVWTEQSEPTEAPINQPSVVVQPPAQDAPANCGCGSQCQCGDKCACGTRYTAGGYSYRVKAGRVEVFVQRCVNGQCSGEWTDWYSLPNNQRAAIRGGETRKAAAGCASGNCGVGNWQPRRLFGRRR